MQNMATFWSIKGPPYKSGNPQVIMKKQSLIDQQQHSLHVQTRVLPHQPYLSKNDVYAIYVHAYNKYILS